MPNPFMMMLGGSLSLLWLMVASPAQAEEGKDLFQKSCASCHTIGGGDGVGPDLKGVTAKHPSEWLVRIITEPDKLTADKDPAQMELVKKYGMEMPKLGISTDDARKLIAFLQGGGAAAPAGKEEAPSARPATAPLVATPALIAHGRDLFTGKVPFAKGGAPCVSCHNFHYPGIYGGALAADLTDVYGKLGESGVRGVLKSLSFPVMKRVYADRPIDDAESDALVSFFQDAAARKRQACNPFPLSGLGFFVLFIIAAMIIKRRIR